MSYNKGESNHFFVSSISLSIFILFFEISVVNSPSVSRRTSNPTPIVSPFWHYCEVVRLLKQQSSLDNDGIIS